LFLTLSESTRHTTIELVLYILNVGSFYIQIYLYYHLLVYSCKLTLYHHQTSVHLKLASHTLHMLKILTKTTVFLFQTVGIIVTKQQKNFTL
jgi:hypothetical protein